MINRDFLCAARQHRGSPQDTEILVVLRAVCLNTAKFGRGDNAGRSFRRESRIFLVRNFQDFCLTRRFIASNLCTSIPDEDVPECSLSCFHNQ